MGLVCNAIQKYKTLRDEGIIKKSGISLLTSPACYDNATPAHIDLESISDTVAVDLLKNLKH